MPLAGGLTRKAKEGDFNLSFVWEGLKLHGESHPRSVFSIALHGTACPGTRHGPGPPGKSGQLHPSSGTLLPYVKGKVAFKIP